MNTPDRPAIPAARRPPLTPVLTRHRFLEAPRWQAGRIWASDVYDRTVHSALPDSTDTRVEATLQGSPSGSGFLPDGQFIVALMDQHMIMRIERDGTLAVHAATDPAHGNLNDMVVDDLGRAYVGALGFNPAAGEPFATGYLERIDPDGTVTTVAENLWFPNGSVITDGQLLVAESFGNRITAFDITDDGGLSRRREWVRFGDAPTSRSIPQFLPGLDVTPDGIALDATGGLWVADPEHHRVLHVHDGIIDDSIGADVEIFACAISDTPDPVLFLCLAPDSKPSNRLAARDSTLVAVKDLVGGESDLRGFGETDRSSDGYESRRAGRW